MIYQLHHQPQQTHIHARNNNYTGILGYNKSSQCKTRNVENVNDKCFNYYSNGVCSLAQPRNSNRSYTKNICGNGCNINNNNGVDIVHDHFTNNNNNNNSNSSNPEYIRILKNKINELQQENEMLKDKYSYVSEMLSSERNNVMPSCYSSSDTNCNNINAYEIDYQSLNELKQENLQFKKQIEILSQRIQTLEAEKQQYEQDTYNNNNNCDTIDATNNINNSTTLNTINTTTRKPKHNHSTTTTTSKYNRNSISYGNANTNTRKGIMNLKKKSSNINKVKHSACSTTTTTTTKHSPKSAVIKKAKMKIKIPKHSTINHNDNECTKEYNVVKDMNSVYNVNTQIQKMEMNVLKLSNEFNKLINQRYCDNEIVKDVITKVSNDLISKTEMLLGLYKQQHAMITMHLA